MQWLKDAWELLVVALVCLAVIAVALPEVLAN